MPLGKPGKAWESDDPSQENCLFDNHRKEMPSDGISDDLRAMGRGFHRIRAVPVMMHGMNFPFGKVHFF